jgi:hypothetical protein
LPGSITTGNESASPVTGLSAESLRDLGRWHLLQGGEPRSGDGEQGEGSGYGEYGPGIAA